MTFAGDNVIQISPFLVNLKHRFETSVSQSGYANILFQSRYFPISQPSVSAWPPLYLLFLPLLLNPFTFLETFLLHL